MIDFGERGFSMAPCADSSGYLRDHYPIFHEAEAGGALPLSPRQSNEYLDQYMCALGPVEDPIHETDGKWIEEGAVDPLLLCCESCLYPFVVFSLI
jgi:hypothetical protein